TRRIALYADVRSAGGYIPHLVVAGQLHPACRSQTETAATRTFARHSASPRTGLPSPKRRALRPRTPLLSLDTPWARERTHEPRVTTNGGPRRPSPWWGTDSYPVAHPRRLPCKTSDRRTQA